MAEIPEGWETFFEDHEDLLTSVLKKVDEDYAVKEVYPRRSAIFRIFRELDPTLIRVVWIGMDPYPDGSANGIAFMVPERRRLNTSLANIMTLVERSGYAATSRNLLRWVNQGVFLYNYALTVVAKTPGSHLAFWEEWSRTVVEWITTLHRHLVIVLVGRDAQRLKNSIKNLNRHQVTMVAHPATVDFLESNVFHNVNTMLKKLGEPAIDWSL